MKEYERWRHRLKDDPEFAQEFAAIKGKPKEIEDRFGRPLSFGTAGLRGAMGAGTNRMNRYTVRQAAQGLADNLNRQKGKSAVAIAYDSRRLSDVFARESACVLAANGITAHLFPTLMPTPALSFAVRYLGCGAGIVITASHNPGSDNGFKVYGSDGGQIRPDDAKAITACIRVTDVLDGARRLDYDEALQAGRIRLIPDAVAEEYANCVLQQAIDPSVFEKAGLKVVYTPLNGTGNRLVRDVLRKAGLTDVTVVPEQEAPDGRFPTCPEPNPEEASALELGLRLCESTGADLLIATDPDADRAAAAVRTSDGYRILSGNETGVLLLDYICRARKAKGTLPARPVAVRSNISTALADRVAQQYGVEMRITLTGFKYVGEAIGELERQGEAERFIFGFERSCGYLAGSYVRDKDAVLAALLIAEMACACKLQGRNLVQVLEDIKQRCGGWADDSESFKFGGAGGAAQMQAVMHQLREAPPQVIGTDKVTNFDDYLSERRPAGLPRDDMLEFKLESGCSIIVRPSGTESKIRVYYSLPGHSARQAKARLAEYKTNFSKLMCTNT